MTRSTRSESDAGRSSNRAFRKNDWMLHIVLFFNLAVAQPLYSVLGGGAEFFLAHSFSAWSLATFALVLSVGVPGGIALAIAALRIVGERLLTAIVLVLLATLTFLAILPSMDRLGLGAALASLISLSASIGLGWLYVRSKSYRSFLTYFSWCALIFPISFLLASPFRQIMIEGRGAELRAPAHPSLDRGDVPVFLLVFDELSTVAILDEHGGIDDHNFPGFSRLARNSYWFRNASTNSAYTKTSVPAILTGLFPQEGRLPMLSNYPTNLFNLLAPEYEVVAFEDATRLCSIAVCGSVSTHVELQPLLADLAIVYAHIVIPANLRDRIPPVAGRWSGFANEEMSISESDRSQADKTPAESVHHLQLGLDAKHRFAKFLAAIDRSPHGRFYYLHSLLPHIPYIFLPDGRVYTTSLGSDHLPGWIPEDERWIQDEALTAQGYQRALLQTQFVDRLVGQFLDRLHELKLFEDSLIVVTSDHGSSFVPGAGRRVLATGTEATGLMVPLFVKLPGQNHAEVSDQNVQSVDVAPTILSVLGKTDHHSFDGMSILDGNPSFPSNKLAIPWEGDLLEFQADMIPMLLSAARRKADLFQRSGGKLDHYRLVPYGDLIGRHLDEFSIEVAAEATVTLEVYEALESVKLSGMFVPAFLEGQILGRMADAESKYLAIAMHDRIVGIAPIFKHGNLLEYSAILSPEYLRDGTNRPRFFALEAGLTEAADGSTRLDELVYSANTR